MSGAPFPTRYSRAEIDAALKTTAAFQSRSLAVKRADAIRQAMELMPGRDPNAQFMDALAQALGEIEYEQNLIAEAILEERQYFGKGMVFAKQAVEKAINDIKRYELDLAEARRSDTLRYAALSAGVSPEVANAAQRAYLSTPDEPTSNRDQAILNTADEADVTEDSLAEPENRKSIGKLLRQPERIRDALDFVEMLYDAEIKLTLPDTRGTAAMVVSGENVIIRIPLKFAAPIANSTATVASVSAQLNLLLAALRRTGQLPT